MIKIGKGKAGRKAILRLMREPHNIKMRISLLSLDHDYLRDLTPHFADGSVTIDAGAETSRALDLALFDPFNKVDISPDSPSRSSVYIAAMIKVVYVIGDPTWSEQYSIPIFCGPIDDVERDNAYLSVKCLGKESLSLNNAWHAKTFKKGEKKTDVIREVLRRYAGETKFNIPNLKAVLPNDIKLNREKSPWSVAQKIAKSMGMQLFYDGRGYATLRKRPKNPVLTLDESLLTSFPKASYDLENVINAVQVIGKKPKKAKKKIKYTAVAQRRHPLSPWRLGRGTAPRYLWLVIEDDSIESKKEAKRIAKRELGQGLLAGIEVTADAIPHPALQELDPVKYKCGDFSSRAPLRKFTIPMTAGDDSSYGYLRRARPLGGARGVKIKKKDRGKGGKGGKK